MRFAFLVLSSLVALTSFTSLVGADDDYKLAPITRHWRVRVSINESIETHGKTQYEGLDDVLISNASYSFVVGTTDDDLAGNAYAISQDPGKDLEGVEGTGSYHQKQTFTTTGSSVKKFRMIDGTLDAKNSRTSCLYQKDSWECTVKAVFTGKETWDPNPTHAAPTDYPAGAMATFGGGLGPHQNENWSKAFKLPHDRFTFTSGREIPGAPGSSHSLKVSVDIEPLNSVGYEAVIIPDTGYEQWLPEGPPVAPDTHQPASLGMHVELRDAATHKPSSKSFRVHYSLESSRLVGDCMNYPSVRNAAPPDKPDLYFDASMNRSATIGAETLALDLDDGKGGGAVVVSSRDWGGYAKLRAKVVVSDGAVVDALTEGGGKEALTIPKDDDGDHVADEWEKNILGAHASNADDENTPNGWAGPGDGYTLFEEYRGFIEADPSGPLMPSKGPKKRHVRLDPNKRDVFVGLAVADSLVSLTTAGIAAWARVSSVSVHYIADSNLLAKTSGDYDDAFPRRADAWGDGHPELFGKPQMALWVQSMRGGESPAHADPIRGYLPMKTSERDTGIYGSFGDVMGVTIDLPQATDTVDALICFTDPDCPLPPPHKIFSAWQAAVVPLYSVVELRKRAAWAHAHKAELYRRFTQFTFMHELGHASGMYHHGLNADPNHSAHGEATCPMRYWHMGDNYREVTDFVGDQWDLTRAHDGTAWRWCSENLPQMRLADH